MNLALECPSCGEPVQPGDGFCEGCGHRLNPGAAAIADDHGEVDYGVAAGVTDRGLIHARNEDALHLAVVGHSLAMVICDGVSSCTVPHLAAQTAAATAGSLLAGALKSREAGASGRWDPVSIMLAAGTQANQAVQRVPFARNNGLAAPSCTFVSALWDGGTVTVAWAGDSRAYWIDSMACRQLTIDHSWLQEQTDRMGLEVEANHPMAHSITRWLGADAPEDLLQTETFRPSGPGRLLVCSDGLWNYLPTPADLEGRIHSHAPDIRPIALARSLAIHAIAAGGHDNVTVAVADLVPGPGSAGRD